jgi:hypothetical protein
MYLDDVFVIGCSFQGRLPNLRNEFQPFRGSHLNSIRRNANSCRRKYDNGHVVSPEGIITEAGKLTFVREWQGLKNKHEIRMFLGLCMYYFLFPDSPTLRNG